MIQTRAALNRATIKLASLTIALAASSLPQLAFATPTSTTTYTINTRISGRAPVTRFGPPRVHDAGLANNSGLTIQENPNNTAANAFTATRRVPAGGGGATLQTAVTLEGAGAINEADAFAKAIVGDSLTFINVTSTSELFHLHKDIDISNFTAGGFTPAIEPLSSETITRTNEIFGDGIAGDFKATWSFFSDINGHESSGSSDLPSRIAFDMDFAVGDAREFNITLSSFDQILMLNDPQGTPFDRGELTMQFLSGGTLTDVATGQAACGVTATSASGFNYLQGIDIAACQVGGGGDGGNGGGGAGAVPEPASWALMLCGFGLVGGALRSSRRKAVVPPN